LERTGVEFDHVLIGEEVDGFGDGFFNSMAGIVEF
jgi:hypothetical protein